MPDTQKYDLEGAKNLFDSNMLCEWISKLCTDHPLISYIEDPFSPGDVAGYQNMLKVFKEKHPSVKVSIKGWFGSDLDLIKEHTALVQAESDDEEEEEEEVKDEADEEEVLS
jgi:hypothetical protein